MIDIKDTLFHLKTKQTSYVFFVNEHKHLEHLHYGGLLDDSIDVESLKRRYQFELGSATSYSQTDRGYMLNHLLLETSSYGKGDYRLPMIHAEGEDGVRSTDFLYESHEILQDYTPKSMPFSKKNTSLKIQLFDPILKLRMDLFYSVFEEENVITRHVEVTNLSKQSIVLDRLLSLNLDMDYTKQTLIKLDGAWIREKHISRHDLTKGIVCIDSKKGVSSADHNPAFILESTDGYTGMILVYSGNFEANFEVTSHDLLRVTLGINSFDFRYTLAKEERFIAPEVILSFTPKKIADLSQQFHRFINRYLISENDRSPRPIVINNWEATYFDFNEKKILAIAKKAAQLGMELLCIDDGWFGHRDDDTSSLGDWQEHPTKLKKGLDHLLDKIKAIGLDVGLWFEPEMISKDSALYRAHPDWVIHIPGVEPSFGRNQLMLDLTHPDVRDNIVDQVSSILTAHDISYVKWDHNRNISDPFGKTSQKGAFSYMLTLGLYDVLHRLKTAFPHVLFESCASGGNRADAGMLAYMPQTWTSDNTDPFERLAIQAGAGLFYPLSTLSNHVASGVSHQMFRFTPLETRFNVACFGVLGYELDVTKLTPFESKVITHQIEFYKDHRTLFQTGTFVQIPHPHYTVWAVTNDACDKAIVMIYQKRMAANPGFKSIKIPFLSEGLYDITSRKQFFNIRAFGSLVNEALPINLKVNSWIYNTLANRYLFEANQFHKTLTNRVLANHGMPLPHEFTSTGYNESVMPLPDHYSHLFIFQKTNKGDML